MMYYDIHLSDEQFCGDIKKSFSTRDLKRVNQFELWNLYKLNLAGFVFDKML